MEHWKKICKYCKHYSRWLGDCSKNGSENYGNMIPFDTTCDLWEAWEDDEDEE